MDRMKSMKMAMDNEKSEMAFYNGEAERSNNPVAKALFKTLAEEEKEHMERIGELHKKLLSEGAWPEDVPIEVSGTNVTTVMEGIRRDLATAKEHDDDDIAALKKSIDSESGASKVYADIAKASDNPREAAFFEFLSEIENEHMASLADSLAYLEDPESWLEAAGSAGLDGA